MFIKTNHVKFAKYGMEVTDENFFDERAAVVFLEENSPYRQVYYNEAPVWIRLEEGIMLMDISFQEDMENREQFLMFRDIRLKEHTYFNFHSLAEKSKLRMFSEKDIILRKLNLDITYSRIKEDFHIKEVIDCFYCVRNTNYEVRSESHGFWELNCIDSRECVIYVDQQPFNVSAQQLMLIGPGERHSISTKIRRKACSYLTISFSSDMGNYEILRKRIFLMNKKMYNLLNEFVACSDRTKLHDDDLMISYLKILLIQMIQQDEEAEVKPAGSFIQQKFENELLNEIVAFMEEQINETLLLEDICREFSVSKSTLQILFRKNLDTSPKQYYIDLKLRTSRLLIKEGKGTISQVAMQLGFSSVNYFSRKFKEKYGIPPGEYQKTIYV